jgi:soluble lytic murein transglycosylase-like protein
MFDEIRYIFRIIRDVFARRAAERTATPRVRPLLVLGLLMSGAAWTATANADVGEPGPAGAPSALMERARNVSRELDRTAAVHAREVAPLERVLVSQGADRTLARRVATALVAEARRTNLEPRLLLGVLLVENPWIDPHARSPVGARGLMQVMPFHEGRWRGCAPRLDDVEANICHGARIFASYLQATNGDVERALLRYNGCVRGTNTPNCHAYPNHVLARTARVTLHDWRASRAGLAAAP